MDRRPSLRTMALTLSCLLVPLTILAGVLTSAFYATNNPDNIDITASLAYLRQTMVVSIAVFTLIAAAVVWLIVKMYRNDRNFVQAKLPLVLLAAAIGLMGVVLVVNVYTNSVKDQYLKDHGRPTLDQFFDAVEQQKRETK